MGDMKTPDFDDLLAAFDIPDATGLDAKEPIQEGQEEAESQLKNTGMCVDDSLLGNQAVTSADIPVVSVIVKNTSRQESLEGFGDGLHSGPALQNGFSAQGISTEAGETTDSGFTKSFVSALNGDSSREFLGKAPIQHKPDATPIFSQSFSHLSPVSSPESEDACSRKDELHPKHDRPCFPEASVLVEPSISDNPKKLDLSMFDECPKDMIKDTQRVRAENTRHEKSSHACISNETDKTSRIHRLPPLSNNQNLIETNCNSGTTADVPNSYHVKSNTSKLSSCLEALVALNARKDPSEFTNPREPPAIQNDCMKYSPKLPISPRSPRSPLEAVKRLMKPSDSPISICSDSSGKASPAVTSGSPPAIPRVRIKTIKTTSGQIRRTVTSVLPDSETDEVHSAYESSPSQSMISEDSYYNMSPHQSQSTIAESIVGLQAKGASPSVKFSHSKSEENSRRSATAESAAIFLNSGGPVKRSVAHQGQKPKRVSATAGNTATTNFLPKAVHLASLNLVPHSVAATVAARSTTSHQQSQPALSSTVCSTVPLVHQVKTANPHPRAPVPNKAAGTLNRILNNTNPVPTYVPNLNPPPDSNILLPPRGYCCLECGDSFGVERSLAYHYGRRSVHIEVRCTHCAKTLVFFNKCALLAHAREHKNSGTVMQCTQLHMRPIAEEHMFAPLITEPVRADNGSPPPRSLKNQPAMPLYPDGLIRHRLRCMECHKQLPDFKALAGHYQSVSEDIKRLICKVCSMLLPNKCSLRAHQRLHAHKSPYCCPECGALSRSADIQKHVKENCLHYARRAWYRCLHCDMVFKTLNGQKSHIEEKHCEVFYKCSVCPVAFKTSESCETHLKSKHSASKTPPQLIFKCSCETVFKKKQLLLQHFHQDASKRITCVFKCPECNTVFPQKQPLMQHFKNSHGGEMRPDTEGEPPAKSDRQQDSDSVQQAGVRVGAKRTEGPRKKAEQDRRPRVKPTGWTCGECLQWFPERDQFVSHMKANHGKSMKRYPCRHCEQSFNSATSLRRHIRTDHDGKKRIYTCWYCTDAKTIFTTSVTLKNHISLMHGIKNPDLALMPKTSIQESKKLLGKGLASQSAAGAGERGRDPGGSAEAPSAKRPKTQFRCSKCGFVTEDGAQFQRHIPQHKSDENTPQCLHCGLCFTSGLSLNRHLFIVHKVKDPEEEATAEAAAPTVGAGEKKEPRNQTAEVDCPSLGLKEGEPPQAGEPEGPHREAPSEPNSNPAPPQTPTVSLR